MFAMKFWQRVVAVAALGLFALAVVFFRVSEDEDAVNRKQRAEYRMMVEGRGYKHSGQVSADPDVCSLFSSSSPPHYANLSTIDLWQDTQFNMRTDGEWELPLPDQDQLEAESSNKLTVILMPHSHNDPGWQKTVNEYYADQTKHILNNMVNKLTQYPNMTFIWAETVFFSMWWQELDDAVKVHVKRLIRRGQLEMVLGGWVMPDEASTHYVALVDQLVEGHQWLWENLHVRPENSWSIDPFGHSGTAPYLWQRAGMSNMVVQRVHQSVKATLAEHKALEFLWRQTWDSRGTQDILCHMMPFMLYNIKYTCGPHPFTCLHFDFRQVMGDFSESRAEPVTPDNLPHLAEMLHKQYRSKAHYFQHNTILVPIGDDFRFDREIEWDQQFKNYQTLADYINGQSKWNTHVQWGTLKDYFKLVRQDQASKQRTGSVTQAQFPVLSGDFFPYSDRDNAYWTGYFTTRPFDKVFTRDVQHMIQAADILTSLVLAYHRKWGVDPQPSFMLASNLLKTARQAQGLFQHHDAITGTAKEFVVVDYEQKLMMAYNASQDVTRQALQTLLGQGKVDSPLVFQPETVRRAYHKGPSKQVIHVAKEGTTVAVFNPLGQARQQMVHVWVDAHTLEVLSASSRSVVPSQLGPVWAQEDQPTVEANVHELTFLAHLGPLTTETFILLPRTTRPKLSYLASISVFNSPTLVVPPHLGFPNKQPQNDPVGDIVVDNQATQLTFDSKTGMLLTIKDLATGNTTDINLTFEQYQSQGSGAYLFKPRGPSSLLYPRPPVVRVTKGPLMTRVEVDMDPYLLHRVTLYTQPALMGTALRVDNFLSITTLKDKEVIMRLSSSIKNPDSFFTDQNGFQFIRRKIQPNLSVQANYYPLTSGLIMEDATTRVTLMSAQAHGAAGLEPGQAEVMLDRQLLHDDGRGLGEGVEDVKATTTSFVLMVEQRPQGVKAGTHGAALSLAALVMQDYLQQPPVIYFSTVTSDVFYRTVSPVTLPLPCDLSVLSFRGLSNGNLQYNGTSLILHRRGYDCGFPTPSLICSPSDSSLSLGGLFNDFSFTNIKETSLTHTIVKRSVSPSEKLKLSPMEIYAYHLQF